MSDPQPFVVLSAIEVEGLPVAARSVVELVPGSPLYLAYGGDSNLEPLPLDQQGDQADADHSATDD